MKDQEFRVSVIMPAYNAAATIGRAIASVLRQTEQCVEVIVVDDASTDATLSVARHAAGQDGRVRILQQNVNGGASAARNRALAVANGRWVAPLDADDEFTTERLQRLLALGEQYNVDMVSDNLLLCPEQDGDPPRPMIARPALREARWMSAAEFVAGNVGSRHAPRVSYGFLKPLIRRAFLEGNNLRYEERNRFGEDFLLALACLLRGARWWLIPDSLYRYTVRPGSATDVQSAEDLLRIRTLEETALREHPMVAADPALADALRRHQSVIDHFYYYRAFTDALKGRSVAAACQLLLQHPASLRHILTESAWQGPRVAIKALRGGYRRAPAWPPAPHGPAAAPNPGNQV